ncbi:MAG: hypothetical protein J6S49_09640 [Erysipelotrichaceae bacterium]|nr:hypothetical protein [Erysipelotrichaceae bacterium]
MLIYSGIQLVYSHVQYFVNQIAQWFQNIEWNLIIDEMPLNYVAFTSACLMLLLAMAAVGLVKKLSFLLG